VKKIIPPLLLVISIFLSLGGIAAYIYLFIPDFNIYWLILSPVIIVMYQTPAYLVFRQYKKFKDRESTDPDET
jgi:hypothetical protein